ncbi:MAG: ferritin-like domain-containing protein, partial [Sphingobium sp.]
FGAGLPHAFVDDWMTVGAEEAMHFALVDRRLRQMGSHYGALPAHEGLWDAAHDTRHDLAARLAIVPLVLEARGLDVTPPMIARLQQVGDEPSARILKRIADDEIRHVAAGVKWFEILANGQNLDAALIFQGLVKRHFRGAIKPPFNDSARRQAGLTQEYYTALAR